MLPKCSLDLHKYFRWTLYIAIGVFALSNFVCNGLTIMFAIFDILRSLWHFILPYVSAHADFAWVVDDYIKT
jgi:hypothetical protein